MQTIKVTYENFDGENVEEQLYFHLGKGELTEMELKKFPLSLKLAKATSGNATGADAYDLMREFIAASYGQRSEDGRRFIKDERETQAFLTSPAYDALLDKLLGDDKFAYKFLSGLFPKDILEKAQKVVEENPGKSPAELRVIVEAQNA